MIEARAEDQWPFQQALMLAEDLELPLTARSLSLDEIKARDWRRTLVWLPILIGLVWFLFLPMREPDRGLGSNLALLVTGAIGTIAVAVGWGWHLRRGRRHIGPDADIEVSRDRITVHTPGEAHEIDYRDVEFGLTTEVVSKSGTRHFRGIVLETPVGPLHLQDQYFESGLEAAAAIIRVCNGGDRI